MIFASLACRLSPFEGVPALLLLHSGFVCFRAGERSCCSRSLCSGQFIAEIQRWRRQAKVGLALAALSHIARLTRNLLIFVDIELPAPSDAITAVVFHPTDPERLLCSAWDGVSYFYIITNLLQVANALCRPPERPPPHHYLKL